MTGMNRRATQLLATALLCAASATACIAGSAKNVLELFTSQGCSSCPAADALFKDYVNRPDTVALSFNVDYWDYLGWKDTLGKAAYSKRQRRYAIARGDGKVYTPQIVANGLAHAVGSVRHKVDRALSKSADRLSGYHVKMTLENNKTHFVIHIGKGTKPAKPATVYIAAVSPSVTVKIKRGENHGRKITYHNVVRTIIPVGMWSGEATTIRMRSDDVLNAGGKRCAVLLQTADAGPILAADWMPE
jgi:hypothetical protein